MSFFFKFSRSLRNLCESEFDSIKSRDDQLNSPKSGVWIFRLVVWWHDGTMKWRCIGLMMWRYEDMMIQMLWWCVHFYFVLCQKADAGQTFHVGLTKNHQKSTKFRGVRKHRKLRNFLWGTARRWFWIASATRPCHAAAANAATAAAVEKVCPVSAVSEFPLRIQNGKCHMGAFICKSLGTTESFFKMSWHHIIISSYQHIIISSHHHKNNFPKSFPRKSHLPLFEEFRQTSRGKIVSHRVSI